MENKELIKRALEFARKEFTKSDISLSEVASNAGFSVDYFNRIFASHTGFTVMAYVNYLRLKKAAELLRKTDKSVLDIALEVGYDSHEGFTRAFKREYGKSPVELRNENKVLCWADMVDKSVINRFFLENPQFQRIDNEQAINLLLENNAKRFGYLCTTIKYMGMQIASESGNLSEGFVCVGDDRNGNCYLEIVNDNFDVLAEWLLSLENISAFYSAYDAKTVEKELKKRGINKEIKATPQATYTGEKLQVDLPENITIRKLSYEDKNHILTWANGKKNGFIDHLLCENAYKDESVLDFGVFSDREMIAVVGCGVDSVHGYSLNNCCNIMFGEKYENKDLYKSIFKFVTNYVLDLGILPFDDIQHGEYAEKHGGFTSAEIGFETVNWRYDFL